MSNKNELAWALDTTLVISLSLGLFYLMGYAYHESFLNRLGVPAGAADLTLEIVTLYGSIHFVLIAIVLATLLVLTGALGPRVLVMLRSRSSKNVSSDSKPLFNQLETMGIGLFVIAVVVVGGVRLASYRARISADRFAKGHCVPVQLERGSGEKLIGCFAANARDGVWFVTFKSTEKVSTGTMYLPVSDIVSMRSWVYSTSTMDEAARIP